MKNLLFCILLFLMNGLFAQLPVSSGYLPEKHPVFQVNFVHPTADKPQSKLWYMDECWWAILPDSTGPTLWQRTGNGWKEHPGVRENLKGIPGRADVWAEKNQVTAVGVADSSLTVFRLLKKVDSSEIQWTSIVLSKLFPLVDGTIETATIAKDGKGIWWVAATSGSNVYAWNSANDGKTWNSPFILSEGLKNDDICTITPLKGGVGVIWSDQVRDAIVMRVHKDSSPAEAWENEEIADSGNKTADDHLNTVLTSDGTLWLTTKNSVDEAGKPQFVLRIRSVDGKWVNKPYLVLESRDKRPSRPIVVATEDGSYIFAGHGDNDRSVPYPHNSNITFALIDTTSNPVWRNPEIVIAPDSVYKNVVHNVTGPKNPFPKDAPWIILAGDAEGQIYEADLRKLLRNDSSQK